MNGWYLFIASVVILAMNTPAEGQRGLPPKKPIHVVPVKAPVYTPYHYHLYHHRPVFPYRPYYYPVPYRVPYYVYTPEYIYVPNYYQPPVGSTLPANVPATAVLPPPQSNQAVVCAVLPTSTAKLWFDGQPTSDGLNTVRCYTTPDLPLGQKFHYHVKAEWFDRGTRVIEERTAEVSAGMRVIVDFTKPAPK